MSASTSRLEVLRTRKRARDLASDKRAGLGPRVMARRAQQDFLRHHWRLIGATGAATLAFALIPAYFLPNEFVQGVAVGGALVGVPALIWNLVTQSTGTAVTMMGDQAEQWTAQELRKNKDDRVVNHFQLDHSGDIDHVVVGPRGLIAVETKWSSKPWDSKDRVSVIRSAAVQAASNARRYRCGTTSARRVRPHAHSSCCGAEVPARGPLINGAR